jgi:hypothetical protein
VTEMSEIDLDSILKAASSDTVGKNADSILGMLQQANQIIGEMDKVLLFLKKIESSILVSAAVKMKAKAAGIELTPLSNDGLIPVTEVHGKVMENINKLNIEQLNELIKIVRDYDGSKQKQLETGKTANK